MSFVIRRSLAARDDLIAIWVSIALHDEAAADRDLDRIDDTIRRLAEFPRLGARRDEIMAGVRAILRSPYLVLYRVEDAEACVDILRVIDARRDLEALFRP